MDTNFKPGYHLSAISKGILGEFSKIEEEFSECKDAVEQNISIMVIHELSDLYGAIEAYLKKHHSSITMDDLKAMSNVTKRAFNSGHRT